MRRRKQSLTNPTFNTSEDDENESWRGTTLSDIRDYSLSHEALEQYITESPAAKRLRPNNRPHSD